MLQNRIRKTDGADELTGSESDENPLIDTDFDTEKDYPSAHVIDKTDWTDSEIKKMQGFAKGLEELRGINQDSKVVDVVAVVETWLRQGFYPVLFCRYIATANYLGRVLKQELLRRIEGLNVQVALRVKTLTRSARRE